MRRLNKIYRKKDYPANVLSFPLSEDEGEILINKNCQKNKGVSFICSLIPFCIYPA